MKTNYELLKDAHKALAYAIWDIAPPTELRSCHGGIKMMQECKRCRRAKVIYDTLDKIERKLKI